MDGFEIIQEVIDAETEQSILSKIQEELDGLPANRHGKGERSRVLRYGYDYTEKIKKLEPIPAWLYSPINYDYPGFIAKLGMVVNSVTINEYQPGHGISPHVDSDNFGPIIAILSLGSSARMELQRPCDSDFINCVELPPRSLAILSGELRSKWTHAIDGRSVTKTRYSIVFRERLLK